MAYSTERFPSSLYAQGTNPDARFSRANERTFLAWVRTSLALIAGRVALEALGLDLHPGLRLAASITLIVTGTAAPIQAWYGWLTTERALRPDRPLPSRALSFPIVIAVAAAGVLIFLSVILA